MDKRQLDITVLAGILQFWSTLFMVRQCCSRWLVASSVIKQLTGLVNKLDIVIIVSGKEIFELCAKARKK